MVSSVFRTVSSSSLPLMYSVQVGVSRRYAVRVVTTSYTYYSVVLEFGVERGGEVLS
jgi:hypothetical protein